MYVADKFIMTLIWRSVGISNDTSDIHIQVETRMSRNRVLTDVQLKLVCVANCIYLDLHGMKIIRTIKNLLVS